MKTTATVLQMLIRLTGVILIVLGALMWAGKAMTLLGVHIITGFVLVVSLWILAGLAFRTKGGAGLAALTLIWGLLLVMVGFGQLKWMIGPNHWVIQVVHLVLGVAAIGLGEALGARIKRASAA